METKLERAPAPREEPGIFDALQESLGRSFDKVARDVLIAAACVTLAGCSPQDKSYFSGAFTPLPPPPPEARLQLSVSTEADGTVFINYVVWDGASSSFMRKDIHYTSAKMLQTMNFGDFREAGGYKQVIHDGEVLMGSAIVNQSGKEILLPNGFRIDGPTGNVLNQQGTVVKTFNPAK